MTPRKRLLGADITACYLWEALWFPGEGWLCSGRDQVRIMTFTTALAVLEYFLAQYPETHYISSTDQSPGKSRDPRVARVSYPSRAVSNSIAELVAKELQV